MPSHRFPILIWRDFAGQYTACLVEEPFGNAAAVGDTPAEAASRVKEYLSWLYREAPWTSPPDFLEPVYVVAKVEVRPEYEVGMRRFPCEETVTLRVPCVQGKDSAGMLLCSMPTLGQAFAYHDADSFRSLVTHHVQGLFDKATPQQLSRCVPPEGIALDDVVVHVPRPKRVTEPQEKVIPALSAIADPVGAKEVRGRLARAWEREAQVNRVVVAVARERASVLLVGEAGSGKTAVLAEAVRKIERGESGHVAGGDGKPMPPPIQPPPEVADPDAARPKHRFWLTSAARLIAGMAYLGQWQERCEEVIAELGTFDGYLCLEDLLDLVRTGGMGPGDSLAAFLLPYLQRGELRIIGEATPAELDACRRLLPGLVDVCQIVNLPPFTRPQAIAALERVASAAKQQMNADVDRGVVEQAYRLFARFMPYESFPGKAASFVRDLVDRVARRKAKASDADGAALKPEEVQAGRPQDNHNAAELAEDVQAGSFRSHPPGSEHSAASTTIARRVPLVTSRDAIDRFIQTTGLPERFLRDDLPLDIAEVESAFNARVIGQPRACHAAATLVTTFKAGMNDPGRPVGVLLFCGPTGVGKTELARAVSEYLFGHGERKDRMVRLDMSEYAGPGAARRLIGEAEGEPSELIRRIRQQPFSVVLFDEIEKAAPEVFDVLMGVFDEGRLTDRFGRTSTFRSSVIVMTSNIGASAGEAFGLSRSAASTFDAEVQSFFRPEFYNRIDAVVTFDPLDDATIARIAEKELKELASREGLIRADLKLTWTDRLVARIARAGFDRRYGARPLQRTLEALVVTPLARYLVDHPDLRNATIRMDLDERDAVKFG